MGNTLYKPGAVGDIAIKMLPHTLVGYASS